MEVAVRRNGPIHKTRKWQWYTARKWTGTKGKRDREEKRDIAARVAIHGPVRDGKSLGNKWALCGRISDLSEERGEE